MVSCFNFWQNQSVEICAEKVKKLKYWPFVADMWNKNDNLRTIKRVFDRLDHERVNGSVDNSWDVMWSIEYPSDYFEEKLKSLQPHQKVNHFPGIMYVTYKGWMTTHNHFSFIPRAFEFPLMKKDFEKFSKENPQVRFVEKSGSNRGVNIVSIDEINLNEFNDNIYQEFIENPLLIDDRVFDLGVYVLITSIDPLRIYRFKSEVLMRFCPKPYYPFDPANVDKYVIQESQKTIFEMPSLKDYVTKLGFSFKMSFDAHLRSRHLNPDDLWAQVDDAIITLITANEKHFIDETNKYAHPEHFFELVRFDFIIDNDLIVHLMEVNMSPNLTPAEDRFEKHATSYEQVVFNTLRCVMDFEEGNKVLP